MKGVHNVWPLTLTKYAVDRPRGIVGTYSKLLASFCGIPQHERMSFRLAILLLLLCADPVSRARGEDQAEPSLWSIQQILAGKKMIDLTHAFAPGIPHWPGFPDEKRQPIY